MCDESVNLIIYVQVHYVHIKSKNMNEYGEKIRERVGKNNWHVFCHISTMDA